jgi:hypothetical protein
MPMPLLDPNAFHPAVAPLLAGDRLPVLGPGEPNLAAKPLLRALTPEALFPAGVRDSEMARAFLAGLWLLHDFLDESHEISQEIETPTGSFWHGIMHRREPDYGNAKYWFRRVGAHAVFEPLRREAARLAAGAPPQAAFLATQPAWDPFTFIDLCEASATEGAACHALARRVQRVEWDLLFAHCYEHAAVR